MALSYLALGDSYTVGEGERSSGTWPYLLAETMRHQGIPVSRPNVIARTGWTTSELLQGIQDADIADQQFDLVSLLIGVNNQYRGGSADDFAEEFEHLLLRALEFAGGRKHRLFAVSIPDWGNTPFAAGRDKAEISAAIDRFNARAEAVCLKHALLFIDICPISRSREALQMLTPDGLHPSEAMYRIWTGLISSRLLRQF